MPGSKMKPLHQNHGSFIYLFVLLNLFMFALGCVRAFSSVERRKQETLTTISSLQVVPFTGMIQGGLQDGHKITVIGAVLPSGGNRYRRASLSASPLSEPQLCQLRRVHPASSRHPHLAQGVGKARPCQQCTRPRAPARSIQGTIKQTPQRQRGMEAHG